MRLIVQHRNQILFFYGLMGTKRCTDYNTELIDFFNALIIVQYAAIGGNHRFSTVMIAKCHSYFAAFFLQCRDSQASHFTIADYQAKAGEYGFTIEAIGVTAQAEVTQAADNLINKKVDCFSNLTDNNVVGVLSSILEKTNEAGIPVYGSEAEHGGFALDVH